MSEYSISNQNSFKNRFGKLATAASDKVDHSIASVRSSAASARYKVALQPLKAWVTPVAAATFAAAAVTVYLARNQISNLVWPITPQPNLVSGPLTRQDYCAQSNIALTDCENQFPLTSSFNVPQADLNKAKTPSLSKKLNKAIAKETNKQETFEQKLKIEKPAEKASEKKPSVEEQVKEQTTKTEEPGLTPQPENTPTAGQITEQQPEILKETPKDELRSEEQLKEQPVLEEKSEEAPTDEKTSADESKSEEQGEWTAADQSKSEEQPEGTFDEKLICDPSEILVNLNSPNSSTSNSQDIQQPISKKMGDADSSIGNAVSSKSPSPIADNSEQVQQTWKEYAEENAQLLVAAGGVVTIATIFFTWRTCCYISKKAANLMPCKRRAPQVIANLDLSAALNDIEKNEKNTEKLACSLLVAVKKARNAGVSDLEITATLNDHQAFSDLLETLALPIGGRSCSAVRELTAKLLACISSPGMTEELIKTELKDLGEVKKALELRTDLSGDNLARITALLFTCQLALKENLDRVEEAKSADDKKVKDPLAEPAGQPVREELGSPYLTGLPFPNLTSNEAGGLPPSFSACSPRGSKYVLPQVDAPSSLQDALSPQENLDGQNLGKVRLPAPVFPISSALVPAGAARFPFNGETRGELNGGEEGPGIPGAPPAPSAPPAPGIPGAPPAPGISANGGPRANKREEPEETEEERIEKLRKQWDLNQAKRVEEYAKTFAEKHTEIFFKGKGADAVRAYNFLKACPRLVLDILDIILHNKSAPKDHSKSKVYRLFQEQEVWRKSVGLEEGKKFEVIFKETLTAFRGQEQAWRAAANNTRGKKFVDLLNEVIEESNDNGGLGTELKRAPFNPLVLLPPEPKKPKTAADAKKEIDETRRTKGTLKPANRANKFNVAASMQAALTTGIKRSIEGNVAQARYEEYFKTGATGKGFNADKANAILKEALQTVNTEMEASKIEAQERTTKLINYCTDRHSIHRCEAERLVQSLSGNSEQKED